MMMWNPAMAGAVHAGGKGAAPAAVGPDHKTELNQFLQKHCKRPLSKTDIVYNVSKFGTQFQAIVKLNCLGGQEYAGHLSHDQKGAEKSAAQQALQSNAALVQATKVAQPAGNKRPPGQMALPPQQQAAKKPKVEGDNAAITPKTELNTLAMKLSKKTLSKGDTVYVCNKIGLQGYQATVQVVVLPDAWAQRAWAGEVAATKMQAEQSAAAQALKDIKADASLMAEVEAKSASSTKSGNKSKESKTKKWERWEGMMQQMLETFGNPFERKPVGAGPVFGSVLEWKGNMGWLKADIKPDHEAAEWREGKIYVNKKDFVGGLESLVEGQRVKFKIYADGHGLGAEECSPL